MDIRRRTRFSRDIPLRNGKRNGFNKDETEMSGILSDLGSKLATFKVKEKLINRPPLQILPLAHSKNLNTVSFLN